MPLLDVSSLTVSYEGPGGRVAAVDDASFSMEPGEILAVVGESGSGKSSLALAITRLLPSPPATVQARAIRFESLDLLSASEAALRAASGSGRDTSRRLARTVRLVTVVRAGVPSESPPRWGGPSGGAP